MQILIIEDDLLSRNLLQKMLAPHGDCHVAVNGEEGTTAVRAALQDGSPYQLICLDIMMPVVDGLQCLQEIRNLEQEFAVPGGQRAKIIMTTAINSMKSIREAYSLGGCDAYLVKPFEPEALRETLRMCGIVP